jgi:hypothetical protein
VETTDAEMIEHGDRLGDELFDGDRIGGHRRLARTGELDHHEPA